MSKQEEVPANNKRFHDFVSGLVAGIISVTVCNPLDIARTRLNVLVYHQTSRMPHFITKVVPSILTFFTP